MNDLPLLDFEPANLPAAWLSVIGLVIANAAQTESILQEAIGGCLGIDREYTGAVTAHMANPLRDSVLRSVAEIRLNDLDRLDELDDILDNIKIALDKRNAIAHCCWCRDPVNGRVYTVKQTARVRLLEDLVEMSLEKLRADADFIYKAGLELMAFLSDYSLLPAIPTAPRPRDHKSRKVRKLRKAQMANK